MQLKKTLKTATHPFPVIRLPFNRTFFTVSLAIAGMLAACVTVNVNFPESAVQKATDDYVRDIYRTKEQGKATPGSKPTATATPGSSPSAWIAIIPSAEAAPEASFNLSSPKADQIKARLHSRIPDVIEQKRAGVIGEANDGSLVIHDASKVKPLLKVKVETLVRDENQDRQSLYAEVVASNHLGSNNLASVKKSFTRSFQALSPSGTWVQADDGSWSQKP